MKSDELLSHIPDEQVRKDIADTLEEISRMTVDMQWAADKVARLNKSIAERQTFVSELRGLLDRRKEKK